MWTSRRLVRTESIYSVSKVSIRKQEIRKNHTNSGK
jgi:hypothetical protein